MRIFIATSAGLAFLLSACSSSTGSSATATATTSGGRATTGGQTLLAAGEHCAGNQACASGVCGASGSGNCCAQACSTDDPTCGAIGCDGTGACSYPNRAITCPSSCTSAMLSQNTCNGDGGCVAVTSAPCPGNFGCDHQGACNSICSSAADCATGFTCNAQVCVAPVKVGTCTEDDDCTSGQCGIHGLGHCCVSACTSVTPPCGATDCDAETGACAFPVQSTPCGTILVSCTGSTLTNPTQCDGLGTCETPGPTQCTPYSCEGAACGRTCGQDGGCASGAFCEMSDSTCCAGLVAGGTINVDAKLGNDLAACCGIGTDSPCQTITQAMALIYAAQAQNVTILATVNGGVAPADWNPKGETFPLALGWGAELKAPGVYFSDPGSNGQVFSIGRISGYDHVGYASIVGATGNPVYIGNSYEGVQSRDSSIVLVQGTNALYIANATINSSEEIPSTAIEVEAGATLVLGGDKAAAVTGTVTIGNIYDSYQSIGYRGIVCDTAKNLGCTISDVPVKGAPSVVIEGQESVDIDAEDYAVVTLTAAAVIGLPPTAAGFQKCTNKTDNQAVLLNGKASVTIDNGTVQCISGHAFQLQATANGVPSLILNGTTVQNTGLAVYASAGTASLSNSILQYNGTGVEQATDGKNIGTIDLSGGASDGGTNIVVCSSNVEGGGSVVISVLNNSSQNLDASNVSWDTAGPDVFKCTTLLNGCVCQTTPSCTDSAGANGMDAVFVSTGTVTTTGNQLSSVSCTPGG